MKLIVGLCKPEYEREDMIQMEKQTEQPAVSIVMPVYNVDIYLREALDSILGQTLENLEVICVNDGSTDNSLSILQEYAAKDDRVVIVDKLNAGYGNAMNVGMDKARGEYLAIVESDDFIAPNMYERLYEVAQGNVVDFVRSDFYKFKTDEQGERVVWREHLTPKRFLYRKVLDPARNLDLFNAQMLNWTGLYRTSFIRGHGIRHNESPGASYQDNGFWFQTYCCAQRIYLLDEPFYFYRQDNMASSINRDDKVFCMPDEYAWIRKFLADNPGLEAEYLSLFHYKKMHNYNFAFSLLAPQFQMPFLERYAREYCEAQAKNELDEALFHPEEWVQIQEIMMDPGAYCLHYNEEKEKRLCYDREHEEALSRGKFALLRFHLRHEGFVETCRIAFRRIFY